MKRILLVLLVTVVALSTAFAGGEAEGGEPSMEPMTLRFGAVNPLSHPFLQGAAHFAELVNERTDGRITIELFPSSQLGGVSEMVQSVQVGALDFTFSKPGTLADMGYQDAYVYELPYVFRSEDHLYDVMLGPIGEELLSGVQEAGTRMVALCYYSDGARSFFFTDEVVTELEDMQGLKVRVQNIQMFVDLMDAFGASATPIAYSELYSALQTGVVDAGENPIAGYYTNNFWEVAPYFTYNEHTMAPSLIYISEITWNKLSESDQQIIKEAAVESTEFVRDFVMEKNQEFIAAMEAEGVEFYQVEDKDEWIEAARPVFLKYGEGLEGLIERIQAVR
jgi:TRAP-type transport system periplasmic protein